MMEGVVFSPRLKSEWGTCTSLSMQNVRALSIAKRILTSLYSLLCSKYWEETCLYSHILKKEKALVLESRFHLQA